MSVCFFNVYNMNNNNINKSLENFKFFLMNNLEFRHHKSCIFLP